jgi:two-component system chemotaxis sensor kinase CheA
MDVENYKDIFIEEAKDHIKNMNNALLALEKNNADITPLNELFRSSHTLKGMAATMGYDKLAEFTHMLEEIMDRIRDGKMAMDVSVINLLFKSVDTLEKFIESILRQNIDATDDYKEIIKDIKSMISNETETIKKNEENKTVEIDIEIEENIIKEAQAQNLKVYKVKVNIAKGCVFKNVRAFMVFRNLSEKGEIIKSSPPAKDIEEGNFDDSFFLVFISQIAREEVEKILLKIAEIEKVAVDEVKESAAVAGGAPVKDAGNKAKDKGKKEAGASQSVRVNIEKLDIMMNLVGELVINKIRLDQISKEKKYNQLLETTTELDRIIDELQVEVTQVRMLPVSHIFERYPRMIRDLAQEEEKEIEVEITGGDIEIDRTLLEEITEPMIHLIRNAVGHGIEPPEARANLGKNKKGLIRISARRERNSVLIEVSDDGRGIDVSKVRKKAVEKNIMTEEKAKSLTDEEAINLIALPGFSTVDKADKMSGRGVGVDVVKTKVESFGGTFKIENFPGEGTKFTLKLPLTLAIIQALLIKSNSNIYALPVIHTTETLEIPANEIKMIQDKRVIILRSEVIPVISLAELLKKERKEKEIINIVIVEVRDKKIALEIDEVMGQQEIAIKSLGEFLRYARGFSGVTILGDGKISLIVDVPALI